MVPDHTVALYPALRTANLPRASQHESHGLDDLTTLTPMPITSLYDDTNAPCPKPLYRMVCP
jgi:hypothetical protein